MSTNSDYPQKADSFLVWQKNVFLAQNNTIQCKKRNKNNMRIIGYSYLGLALCQISNWSVPPYLPLSEKEATLITSYTKNLKKTSSCLSTFENIRIREPASGIIYSILINSISPNNLSMVNVVMLELILDHTMVITKGFEQWTSYIRRRYLTHVVCTKFTVRTVLLST